MSPGRAAGHRQRLASATRAIVAAAARKLFAERGYVGTTIEAISAASQVPIQTIYSAFGGKAAILEEVRQEWIAASQVANLHAEAMALPDPVERLRRAAHWTRRQFELGSDVILVHQEAARTDARAEAAWIAALAVREAALRQLIQSIKPHLRRGLSARNALDVYVALTLPEIYRSLVAERGWSADRYERWLGGALIRELLAQPQPNV